MVMKKNQEAKNYSVKLLRGAKGPDMKQHKAGAVLTCNRNLTSILVSTGRGEVVTGKADKADA